MTHPSPSKRRCETTFLEAASSTLALRGASQRFVYRELTERVIIVIVIGSREAWLKLKPF